MYADDERCGCVARADVDDVMRAMQVTRRVRVKSASDASDAGDK